ncbi:uncharacterized protein LOC123517485 isoform X2 [Portunus trituberculatus]|uniref:uncharacterized protein LOC123517485 isoform X2 n=1 Tax=Portunus trituberculatus TaxID=210409 RepID=UPI001E1CEF57|nr:uncharacterized protein LOC123517485 isoform X2 [Portunus trituberculatus]XP_045133525.1 uncharacterized protein LOC123517485 isoform X2 [Portunus trituberculatus]
MGVPLRPALLACVLATFAPAPGQTLEILQVSLEGGRTDYLEVEANVDYTLNCEYRTPYDDPVKEVLWMRFGKPFYKWGGSGSPTVLDTDFLGVVNTSPDTDPHNVHFIAPVHYNLDGIYVCQVFTNAATANASYNLHVVDGGSWPTVMTVEALSKIMSENDTATASDSSSGGDGAEDGDNIDQNKYEVDQTGGDDTEVAFENKDCTLVWSLSTPAIYPRPNVTCGHYSFDHEDVVERLPAGLTLHKYPNGSWTASFTDTHVQVSSLPKNHRLGCSIRIPDTSFKMVVRAEDDLWVDSLIDTGGCSGIHDLQERGLIVEMRDATYTCRGDVLPASRSGPAVATISCPEGYAAIFPDQPKKTWIGSLELSCAENDVGWRRYTPEETMRLGDLVNPDSLPICVRGHSGAASHSGSLCSLTVAVTLVLGWLLHV